MRTDEAHTQVSPSCAVRVIFERRQDLVGELRAKDKQLIAARSEAPAKRDANAEKVISDRLAAIGTRVGVIDKLLTIDFPDYAALARSSSISVKEVQSQLGGDEALVLFLDTDGRFALTPGVLGT